MSYERKERSICGYTVRRVPCFSGGAPTTYRVYRDGREVNSFLSASYATAWCKGMRRTKIDWTWDPASYRSARYEPVAERA